MPTKNEVQSTPAWQPTSAGKQQATSQRIFAAVLWVVAIGIEAFAIFWILKQPHVNMALLIGAIVVTGILAVGGDLLWKRANQLDPASTSEPGRFFIQNQLGAIISLIAFLPMIIMIFLNKNMNGQQKGIAGGIGIVVLVIAAVMGISFHPPSVQQYQRDGGCDDQRGLPAAVRPDPCRADQRDARRAVHPGKSAAVPGGERGGDRVHGPRPGVLENRQHCLPPVPGCHGSPA